MVSKTTHHDPHAHHADLTQRNGVNASDLPDEALPDATGTWVVDTNVILVANGQHDAVDAQTVKTCARWLRLSQDVTQRQT